ncbi:hypothetical protein [Streptomyces sp. NPDC050738]|uniref:hypothetical protein n=1 Tax=Streptomyces sp. NPDC050738 TaxID=3154744 RepID=UPI003438023B
MSPRRILSLTLAVAASAALLTACGARAEPTAHDGPLTPSAVVSSPSYAPRPECAKGRASGSTPSSSPSRSATTASGGGASPKNPHYDENHAYRMAGGLSADARAAGEATVRLIRPALESIRKDKRYSEKDVRTVLATWGCGEDNGLSVSSGWPQYERVLFSFHNGHACISAEITPKGVATQVHGAYAEPDPAGPCVENRGGH